MAVDVAPALRDVRVAGPVAAAWICAAIVVGVPGSGWWVLLGSGLAVVGAVGGLVRHTRGPAAVAGRAAAVVLGMVVAAGSFCAVVSVAVTVGETRRTPAALQTVLRNTALVDVEIVLARDLASGDPSVVGTLHRADVDAGAVAAAGVGAGADAAAGVGAGVGTVDGLRVPVRVVPGAGTVQPGSGATESVLAAGTRVSASAALEPDLPGSSTSFVAFLRGTPTTVAPTGLLAATDHARRAFVSATAGLPEPGGSLLRGLAIGDRSGLDPATEAAMETSALTHLTAVSGANCAVIVGLVVVLGRAVGLPRVGRAVAAIVLLLAFVVLVRPDPSIVRATVMAVVVLLVHLSGRPVRGVPLIALAALGMLVVDPWFARSFAFALSVLATTGIVVLGPPLTSLLARRTWTPLAGALAVPVAAQLACWPVTIPLAAAFPTYAVPANLLTEPLAPIVTVIGLAACLTAAVWPWGATVLAGIAWVPASAIGGIAHGTAALPHASVPWPGGVVGVATAGVVSAAVAVAVLVPAAVRFRLLLLAGVVLLIGISTVVVPRVVVRAGLPADWSVASCDVGQGDAVLLRAGGATALVDTGDDPERLAACLDLVGVEHVDLLVLTHFDRDHVGAVGSVAGRVTTALVGPTGRPEDERVLRSLLDDGVDVRRADADTSGTLGPLWWRVLWPRSGARDAGNDASLVLRTEPGPDCTSCVSGLFLGDLGETAQRRLRATGALADGAGTGVATGVGTAGGAGVGTGAGAGVVSAPSATGTAAGIDVVKVAHHGSADQDPGLYRAVAAPVGLIGVGADNTYGHPTRTALSMLESAGTTAYRTDLHGTVVVRRDEGGVLRVWTERSASAVARRIDAWPPRSPHVPQRRSTRCPGRGSARRRSCW